MTVKIPPVIAEMIGLCHGSLSAAREYARGIANDPCTHKGVAIHFDHIAASCTILLNRLDSRIPQSCFQDYRDQVMEADPLALENIKQLYIRMLPEQRGMLEKAAEAILKKEFELSEFEK